MLFYIFTEFFHVELRFYRLYHDYWNTLCSNVVNYCVVGPTGMRLKLRRHVARNCNLFSQAWLNGGHVIVTPHWTTNRSPGEYRRQAKQHLPRCSTRTTSNTIDLETCTIFIFSIYYHTVHLLIYLLYTLSFSFSCHFIFL